MGKVILLLELSECPPGSRQLEAGDLTWEAKTRLDNRISIAAKSKSPKYPHPPPSILFATPGLRCSSPCRGSAMIEIDGLAIAGPIAPAYESVLTPEPLA